MVIDKVLIIASAIIKNDKGEILLLERGETKNFQKYWQLPEGKLEEKEKPIDALKREIKEELSATVKTLNLESISQSPLEAKNTKYFAIRIIFSVTLESSEITLSSEHSDYKWVLPSEIKNMQLLPGVLEAIES